jgi:hypothetical protein
LYHHGGYEVENVLITILKKCFWRRVTYRDFGLSESRWNVEVFGYEDVSEVVSVLDAPDGQPFNIVDRERAWKLYFDVFTLVASQRVQRSHLVGYLDPKR